MPFLTAFAVQLPGGAPVPRGASATSRTNDRTGPVQRGTNASGAAIGQGSSANPVRRQPVQVSYTTEPLRAVPAPVERAALGPHTVY